MGDANIGEPIQECGECSDCNNFRDISLLKNVSKVFARVTWAHWQSFDLQIYPELQCSSRKQIYCG